MACNPSRLCCCLGGLATGLFQLLPDCRGDPIQFQHLPPIPTWNVGMELHRDRAITGVKDIEERWEVGAVKLK